MAHMVVSLNYCSQNGGNLYKAPYYNGNPNIGPRIIGNLGQYPYGYMEPLGGWTILRPHNVKLAASLKGVRFRVRVLGFRV